MHSRIRSFALLTTIMLLSAPAGLASRASAQDDPLRTVGCWPFGSASAVAFDATRDLVFLGSGGAVLVLDVSDLADPQLLSDEINTFGMVTGLRYDAEHQRLLVAAGWEDLQIWDVAAPAAPEQISAYEIPVTGISPPARNVDLYEEFALVECQWIGAASIDVSDPENPFLVQTNPSMGPSATDIQVSSDGYLHAVGSEYYVRIHIDEDGGIPGLGGAHIGNARAVFGTHDAAFIEQYGDLRIIEYGGGGSITDVGYFYDVVVQGDHAYLGGGSALSIYDVSDLENPTWVGSVDGGTRKLDVSGGHAFLASGASGLRTMDVSDPSAPVQLGRYDTFGSSGTTCLYDDHAYIAQGGDGVIVVDLTEMANPLQVGRFDTPGSAYDVTVVDGLAYVADYDGGLRIADVSDPTQPAELGAAPLETARVVRVSGGRAYVVDDVLNEPDWLRIFDVSDPASPMELGALLLGDDVRGIDLAGDYLYAAADDAGLRVVDVSDPAAPVEVGSYVAESVWDVSVRGDYAYLSSADWHGGFITLDVSDPTDPVYLSNYVPNGGWYHPFDMTVAGDFAYLADPTSTSGAVVVLHIADPLAPVELSTFHPPGDVSDLMAVDSLLYISDGDAGLRIVENHLFSVPGGGVGWQEQESGTGENLRRVHFVDAQTGWIVGDNGIVLRTLDGGEEWLPLESGTSEDLFGVYFVDANAGWICGREGVLRKTTDGGQSWDPQTISSDTQLRSIAFVDANIGWVVGVDGTILHTTNGGVDWEPQLSGTSENLLDVCFVDADHGWIAGGDGGEALTLRTTDGGVNWLTVYPPEPRSSLSSIHFVDQEVGWTSGYEARVYKSIDGGQSWFEQYNDSGTSYTSISSVHAVSANTCWGVGYVAVEGRSMKTVDGGDTWMELFGGGESSLQSVFFVDPKTGWAVGHYGTILAASTNEGPPEHPSEVVDRETGRKPRGQPIAWLRNHPNPVNASTTIRYELHSPETVSLRIFDLSGRVVEVLRDAVPAAAGVHEVVWDGCTPLGKQVPAGVYFYRLRAGTTRAVGRTLVVR
ncbi:MAG: T9SS type A sorting domain-containing protein [Candidatus Eisenbacteria bacterium]|nr:T9SS type A sorting domain-containing protein [Candidatus Eisenbacteria bacterium]